MLTMLLIYFIAINLIGMAVMKSDKKKAQKGEWRVPEKTLWKIAWVGGAVGMTISMHRYHHKNRHMNFKIGFPILAAIQLNIVYILSLIHI